MMLFSGIKQEWKEFERGVIVSSTGVVTSNVRTVGEKSK
jgi:hypothetical protein